MNANGRGFAALSVVLEFPVAVEFVGLMKVIEAGLGASPSEETLGVAVGVVVVRTVFVALSAGAAGVRDVDEAELTGAEGDGFDTAAVELPVGSGGVEGRATTVGFAVTTSGRGEDRSIVTVGAGLATITVGAGLATTTGAGRGALTAGTADLATFAAGLGTLTVGRGTLTVGRGTLMVGRGTLTTGLGTSTLTAATGGRTWAAAGSNSAIIGSIEPVI